MASEVKGAWFIAARAWILEYGALPPASSYQRASQSNLRASQSNLRASSSSLAVAPVAGASAPPPPSSASVPPPSSSASGSWALPWLDARNGAASPEPLLPAGVLTRVLARMQPAHRAALEEPIASTWYPEEALQDTLGALREGLSLGADAFMDAMDACTVIGTTRFFRALLRMATPLFVLRQVPSMWRVVRRGAGLVEVESAVDEARLLYRDFPYFADENYRLLTLASLRAVVRTCTERDPSVTLERWSSTSLEARVRW